MNKQSEKLLRETFDKKLKEVHFDGLSQGAKAIAKVVLDKSNNPNKTPEARLDEIRKFCEVSLNEVSEE